MISDKAALAVEVLTGSLSWLTESSYLIRLLGGAGKIWRGCNHDRPWNNVVRAARVDGR